jgi:hypothetical protein
MVVQRTLILMSDKDGRLDQKIECQNCHTIYLDITPETNPHTPVHCSKCGQYLGSWAELESDFYAQGGHYGVFEMRDGQIICRE